ncbi:MAG: glutamate-1-semialdehyde 2,1-aminomutase [Pseudomonadota bacterium]|nr:glutamate-1-semialdehyde 2,1-aminomutase [Pseudomonadota bacterium]
MQQTYTVDVKPDRYALSKQLFDRAVKLIPGGVNSPVRAFGAVGGTPVFMAGADGAALQDMDGNQYVDYIGSWGPMILGHANPRVLDAVKNVMEVGTSFGAPTDRETALADFIVDRHASIDKVRLVNSGTEATMSAIRLARGYTGRDKILKFAGHYHGHGDSLLVAAGSGLITHGTPSSAGVPKALAELTCVAPFNDVNALEKVFMEHGDDLACVILEPVAGNMGCVPPKEGYLKTLRELCDKYGTVLIFDEVMTGFRLGMSSAQGLFDIEPDLSCFGKVIGGGLPLAAYGGKQEIMDRLSPIGDVYQAGTLSGNPLAVSAGIATVAQLTPEVYAGLEETGAKIQKESEKIFSDVGIPITTHRVGSMFSIYFSEEQPYTFEDVQNTDIEMFKKFFHAMLDEGIYLPPSAYETWFFGTCHDENILDITFTAMRRAAMKIKNT